MSMRVAHSSPTTELARVIATLVADDLAAVELELGRMACCPMRSVNEIGSHLQGAGGKRMRPTLVLLSARMFGCRGSAVFALGAVFEAIHAATLVHDDVIDNAGLRRGRLSTNVVWDNSRCILAGDWLFMQAFKVALEARNLAILDVLIDLTQQMIEGELIQLETVGTVISRDDYLQVITKKTAGLFAGCARLGSMVAGATGAQQDCLATYGTHLGIAFQVADDVLDLVGSEEILGKPPGSDLREGRATLPVLDAFARGTVAGQQLQNDVLRERTFDSVSRTEVLGVLERHGSIDSAMRFARSHAESAREALAAFEDSEIKDALAFVCDVVVNRES